MKKTKKFIINFILVLSILLTACTNNSNDHLMKSSQDDNSSKEKTTKASGSTSTKETTEDRNSYKNHIKLSKIYTDILDNIDSYTFTDSDSETDKNFDYTYALVNMNDSDEPELIVSKGSVNGLSYIKVFSHDEDYTKGLSSDEIITIGVAGVGGFRGSINQNENLNALDYTSFYSGTGEAAVAEIKLTNENGICKIKQDITLRGRIDKLPKRNSYNIVFNDISNRNPIEDLSKIPDDNYKSTFVDKYEKDLQGNKTTESTTQTNTEDVSLSDKIKAERDAGRMVLPGYVKVFNHDEIVEFQDFDPNILPDLGETYVVLILEDYVDINMQSGGTRDHYSVRSTNLIGLPDDMTSYNEQYIIISFSEDDGHWQSDVSLPMNAPRMHQVKVLQSSAHK